MKLLSFILLTLSTAAIATDAPARVLVIMPDGKVIPYDPPATAPATNPTPATVPVTPPVVVVPPVVTPVVTPVVLPPALPTMTRRTAGPEPRGDGVRVPAGTAAVQNMVVDGFEQNIVVQNHPQPTLFENVWSLNSHRPKSPWTFEGQTWYLEKCGQVTLRNCYGERAGWQTGMNWPDLDGFRHIVYSQFDSKGLTIESSWLDAPACAAIQSRGGLCIIRNCLLTRAGVAILAVAGNCRIEHSTVYDGHHYYMQAPADGSRPASWIGNVGLQCYWPVDLDDVWFVGATPQVFGQTAIPNLKSYNLGCIVSGGDYGKPEWKIPKNGAGDRITKLVTAKNCRIVGWPGPPFAGATKHDGTGFTVGGNPVDVWPQLEVIRADMKAGKINASDAAARGQAVVRAAAQ